MKRTERNWQFKGTIKSTTSGGQNVQNIPKDDNRFVREYPDQEQFRCEFFNPDECRFIVHGFFERLVDANTHKGLGTRHIEKPDRPLGSDGLKEYFLTENTPVNRGHKEGLIKASKDRPQKVIGMIELICGWEKSNV